MRIGSVSGRLCIVKSDRELGPYSSAQMKELAPSGQLKTAYQVRTADRPHWYRFLHTKTWNRCFNNSAAITRRTSLSEDTTP